MTTTRTLVFDSPFLLGFEHTRALAERLAKATDSYPPYNVEQTEDGGLRITLAVAGFTPDQLGPSPPSCTGESPPAASSAPSCWPMGWRWPTRFWSTASCIST